MLFNKYLTKSVLKSPFDYILRTYDIASKTINIKFETLILTTSGSYTQIGLTSESTTSNDPRFHSLLFVRRTPREDAHGE